jgi:ribosome-binding protein aMBF1 (putative translation factor)
VSVVVFPGCAPCEICGQAVADRTLEALLVCADCAHELATPNVSAQSDAQSAAPLWEPLEQHQYPSLNEIVDRLIRSPQ